MEENIYYHGTSSVLVGPDKKYIKPPIETGVIREHTREDNRDVVYVTTSLCMAMNFAIKAAKKFGGRPMIYWVEPDKESLIHRQNAEYTTKIAKIISIV